MVKIHRIWFNTERMDREDHYKITLFSRPRVSIHVDEYIWSFIEENIVKPHKLMRSEKHEYLLDIAFGQFDPAKHRYYPLSSYNGLLREGVEMDSANRSYFREEFDGLKPKIDWSIVESFPFPAPFEEQRYIGDEGEIHVYSWDGRKETTLVGPYSVRKLYLEHFGES